MPNSVIEAFILGRNLALQQRAAAQAEEQRRIDNERAEKADKLAQQREDRLVKEAELNIRAKEAELNLQKAQLRAGIDTGVGRGEIPVKQEFGPRNISAVTLDTSNLPGLPQGLSGQQLSPATTINTEPGNAQIQIGPELEAIIGKVEKTPEEIRQLQQIEINRIKRLATEASLSPSVQSQQLRMQAQAVKDASNQRFEIEKMLGQNELMAKRNQQNAELRHANAIAEVQERARLNFIRDNNKITQAGIYNSEDLADLTTRVATGQASLTNFPIKQRAAIEKTASDLGFVLPSTKELENITTDLAQFPVMVEELNIALDHLVQVGFENRGAAATLGALQGLLPSEAKDALQAAEGKLAGLMRKLGEKGVISDSDITRGKQLFPSFSKNIETNKYRVAAIIQIYSDATNLNLARIPVKQRQLIFDNLGIPFKAENITAARLKSRLKEFSEKEPVEGESDLDRAKRLGLVQ